MPRTLLCDQGRAFVSHELEAFATENTIHMAHIAVQAPWQNGLCDRRDPEKPACCLCSAAQSLMGYDAMNQSSPRPSLPTTWMCATTAAHRCKRPWDGSRSLRAISLKGVLQGEMDAMMEEGSFARLVAIRETARMAMLRLHFSKALRRAELARSRNPTVEDAPSVGDLVYYWRQQKYNQKGNQNQRSLLLRRWHGPALLIGFEGNQLFRHGQAHADQGGVGARKKSIIL